MDTTKPRKRRRRGLVALSVILLVVLGGWAFSKGFLNQPVDYDDIVEHFKYGSIGSEAANGIPYWIWKVLPEMFPENLPGKGYESLGFLTEAGHDTPIGFSRRRAPIDRVGLNCAVCHVGTVRETSSSPRQIIPGMPANNLDLQAYIDFLNKCALDPRFSPRYMMPAIEAIGGKLNFIEQFIYRNVAIYQTRDELITQGKQRALDSASLGYWPRRYVQSLQGAQF